MESRVAKARRQYSRSVSLRVRRKSATLNFRLVRCPEQDLPGVRFPDLVSVWLHSCRREVLSDPRLTADARGCR